MKPVFTVAPVRSRIDSPIHIAASGLVPGERVTVRTKVMDGALREWESLAVVDADDVGVVDLSRMAPLEGSTYRGVDGDGPLWSMQGPDQSKFFTRNLPVELEYHSELCRGDRVIASTCFRRHFGDGVTWGQVHEPPVVGTAVSMGGSNEFVECFCWGAVAEGGSGAVVQFVGDGVEVGLVAGDGGSFGKVSADEPVGVFVGSSLPGAVGVSEEHLHAGVVGEALVAGHFPALVPGQCAHRPVGQALDAAGERVTDLVGFPTQRQGDDDQVAGGALNQGRCSRWPRLGR